MKQLFVSLCGIFSLWSWYSRQENMGKESTQAIQLTPWDSFNPGCLNESHLQLFTVPQSIQTHGSPLLSPNMSFENGVYSGDWPSWFEILTIPFVKQFFMDSICKFGNTLSMRAILARANISAVCSAEIWFCLHVCICVHVSVGHITDLIAIFLLCLDKCFLEETEYLAITFPLAATWAEFTPRQEVRYKNISNLVGFIMQQPHVKETQLCSLLL